MSTYSRGIPFANALRGISAIIVIFQHYLHDFWIYNLEYYCIPPIKDKPSFALFLESIKFNFGHLAVDIFFIISGFLISISLEKYSRSDFIKQRMFRIFPSYIFSAIICVFFVYLLCEYTHYAFPYSIGDLLPKFALIGDIFGGIYRNFDLVSWTLEIEMKFYLLCLIFYNGIREQNVKKIYTYFTIMIAVYLFLHHTNEYIINVAHKEVLHPIIHDISYIFFVLKYDIAHMQVIFVGIVLYLLYKQKINIFHSIVACGSLIATFGYFINHFIDDEILWYKILQALFAYLIFFIGLLIHMKRKDLPQKSASKFVRFFGNLADMSYSIYLTHAFPGCVIIYIFLDNIPLGIGISLVYTAIMSFIVHRFIEKPFIKIGKTMLSNSFK